MSAIQTELSEVTGVTLKRGGDRQEFIFKLLAAVGELDDAGWGELSQESQDWFNDAADAKNAKKKQLPDFPDLTETKAEEAPATTRRATKEAATVELTVDDLKLKMMVKITNKRGVSFTGTVTDIDDEVVVLKLGTGEEEEINVSRIATVEALETTTGKSADPKVFEPKVGSEVTVITKRDVEVTGKIVEFDEEIMVLEVDGKEKEFERARLKTIKAAGKAEAPAKVRRAAKEEEEEEEETAPTVAKDEKSKRVSNEGVSIGTRIKELIADNLDADEAAIAKILKKEGLDFKENTLKLNFTDCHKFINILKAKKLIK